MAPPGPAIIGGGAIFSDASGESIGIHRGAYLPKRAPTGQGDAKAVGGEGPKGEHAGGGGRGEPERP